MKITFQRYTIWTNRDVSTRLILKPTMLTFAQIWKDEGFVVGQRR